MLPVGRVPAVVYQPLTRAYQRPLPGWMVPGWTVTEWMVTGWMVTEWLVTEWMVTELTVTELTVTGRTPPATGIGLASIASAGAWE